MRLQPPAVLLSMRASIPRMIRPGRPEASGDLLSALWLRRRPNFGRMSKLPARGRSWLPAKSSLLATNQCRQKNGIGEDATLIRGPGEFRDIREELPKAKDELSGHL